MRVTISRFSRLIVLAIVLGCVTKAPKNDVDIVPVPAPPVPSPCRVSTVLPSTTTPEIVCAAPPSTFEASPFFVNGASPSTMASAGPTFDSWAWSTFAAFNWPAEAASAQPTGYLRGVPDLDQSFINAQGTDTLVWETLKEKREVFNSVVTASGWQQLTFPPDQEISIEGGMVPACSSADREAAAKMPGGAHRRILQASKLAPALGVGPNTLDETAEVAAPAQESQNALCAGYTTTSSPTLAQCQATFPPPPGGSGSSVWPPTITNPRPPVGPRVYDPNGILVFYEVRLNYDYFSYILANGLQYANPIPQTPPPPSVPAPPYSLPWRTSAQGPPSTAKLRSSVINYDPNAAVTAYGTLPTTPPSIGSVQVKSAWRLLGTPDPTYHTTQAVYFRTDKSGGSDNVCYSVGLFGLIGLHIIQRVHMGNSGDTNADTYGGTFIFATWEHNSIENGNGYSYVSYIANKGNEEATTVAYPPTNHAIPVTRQQQYPLASTNSVTQGVYNQLPANSVWRNYRLIGTQFYASAGSASVSLQYNQPYYMANLVIETNNGLQNFQGLSPNITPISQYSGFMASGNAYSPTFPNVSFNGNAQLMGGCMGCHGVAQVLGSNFSFVLLDGQKGAGIDTKAMVSIPPVTSP